MHDGRDRRGVARTPFVSRLPDILSRLQIQRGDGRTARRTDVDDQHATVDQRRRADAEEILPHTIGGPQVAPPDDTAGLQLHGVDQPLGADRVDAAAGSVDDRARTRAVVVAVAIAVSRRVAQAPLGRARLRVQALDDLLVVEAVQVDEPIPGDGRRHVPGAGRKLPDERWRERPAQARLGGHAVVGRSEKGRPVVGDGIGCEWTRDAMRDSAPGPPAGHRLGAGQRPAGGNGRRKERRRQRAERRAPRHQPHASSLHVKMRHASRPSAGETREPGTPPPRPSGCRRRTAATGSPAADCRASRRRRSPPGLRRTPAAAPRSAARR